MGICQMQVNTGAKVRCWPPAAEVERSSSNLGSLSRLSVWFEAGEGPEGVFGDESVGGRGKTA